MHLHDSPPRPLNPAESQRLTVNPETRESPSSVSSTGASIELLIEFSPADKGKLRAVAQSLAAKASEVFSLEASQGHLEWSLIFLAPNRCKQLMIVSPPVRPDGTRSTLQLTADKVKQLQDLCAEQHCQLIQHEMHEAIDSKSEEKYAEGHFLENIEKHLGEFSPEFKMSLRQCLATHPEVWNELELLMQMNPHERHENLAPQAALTAHQINQIFGFAPLVAMKACNLTGPLATEFPGLITPRGLLLIFKGVIDINKITQLRAIPDCIQHNVGLLCTPNGSAGLQEHLFTLEEALFTSHLPTLLSHLHALRDGTVSIQEYQGTPIPAPRETDFENQPETSKEKHFLPEELLVHIFRFLPMSELLQAQRTSRQFYSLMNDNVFWSLRGHVDSKEELLRLFSRIAKPLRKALLNFSKEQLALLASLMKMGTQERYATLDPEKATALTIPEQIRFLSFNNLVAFVSNKLYLAQAKAVPALLNRDCVLCILEDLIKPAEIVPLAGQRQIPLAQNLELLCGIRRPALQKKLFAVTEGLSLNHECLKTLLTFGFQALLDGIITLQQVKPLSLRELTHLLRDDVLQQLRSKTITFEKALQAIQSQLVLQRSLPTAEYPCKCCKRPGGQPDSHWYWHCPVVTDAQPVDPFLGDVGGIDAHVILNAENQRFDRFVAVCQEYAVKGTLTVRFATLGMQLRERYVYSERTGLKPLLERAVEEGLLTRQGDQGFAEVVLNPAKIAQYIERLERRMEQLRRGGND